jgi:hypothetical protein
VTLFHHPIYVILTALQTSTDETVEEQI